MNNNVIKFGYEDTDKKVIVELYGIEFEVKNINEEKIEKFKTLGNDENTIINEIDELLGEGAVEKINNKRINDGHEKMDLQIEIAVLGCIVQAYTKVMTDMTLKNMNKTIEEINGNIERATNINRNYRRNFNNYRGNNKYRRY